MKWFNCEFNTEEAYKLRAFLAKHHVKFETSAAFNLTHFEILLEPYSKEYNKVNKFIEKLNEQEEK